MDMERQKKKKKKKKKGLLDQQEIQIVLFR